MTFETTGIAETLLARATDRARFLVALAGPPGAGKSTLADLLRDELIAKGEPAEVLPMDGFHMDDAVLREKGSLARKGAPDTFDIRGFIDIIRAVRNADGEILVPVFDRSREIAIAAARIIPASTRVVIVEGNYLLLDQPPWDGLAGLFDYTIMIAPPTATLEERLMHRWLSFGLDEATARTKTQDNDLKNGLLIRSHSRDADITIT